MDKLDFLPGDGPAEAEERVETPEPAAEAAETPPEPAPQAAPPPSPPAAPGHVPISAMLDEREKRQGLERQLAELKARAEPAPPADATAELKAALYAQNLRTSRRFAETQYGAQAVAEVHDWAAARCDADPFFNEKLKASDHPYEDAMQAFNRERIAAEVTPADLEAFRAWKAASAAAQPQAQQPAPTPIPRSLATASGNGSLGRDSVPAAQGEAFGALFKG